MKYVLQRVESLVEISENGGYQNFLLSHDILKSLPKDQIVWYRVEQNLSLRYQDPGYRFSFQ